MIFGLLKNWRFLLDALIVVVVIVALFLWNPFGIFGGKAKLVDTANMVTEIRQIGQLVTAEYYGEVISSLEEARLEFIEDENVRSQAEKVFGDLLLAINELRAFEILPPDQKEKYAENYGELKGRDRRRIVRAKLDSKNIREKMEFFALLDDVESEDVFREVFEYWYRRKSNLLGKKNFDFDSKSQDEALAALFFDNSTLPNDFYDGFMAFYYEARKNEFSKKELRKKIAVIGRGWVKAGFDFTNLDASALIYHENRQEIHIMGMSPSILNADINPWFIPEKGVPGFEILDMNSKADFRDGKIVKQYCVRKLEDYAQRANILQNAERQGEETLKNLFSLLLGKEIKKVVFHHDAFLEKIQDITKDDLISHGELAYFDSAYKAKTRLLDSLDRRSTKDARTKASIEQTSTHLRFAIEKLKRLTVDELGEHFSYFSTHIIAVAQDGTIDSTEWATLRDWRITIDKPWVPNQEVIDRKLSTLSIWFKDKDEYAKDFNAALKSMQDLHLLFGPVKQIEGQWDENSPFPFSLDSMKVLNYRRVNAKNVLINYVTDSIKANNLIQNRYYPFRIERTLMDSAIQSKEIYRLTANQTQKDSTGYFFFKSDSIQDIIAFPLKHLELLEPNWINPIIETARDKQIKGNGFTLWMEKSSLDTLNIEADPIQQIEFEQYLRWIATENQKFNNRNFLEKFSKNLSRRIENRSSNLPEWLNQKRSY